MIEIDTIPIDVLHVTCIANSREELLDAAVRAARLYFGEDVELAWSEAKVKYIGAMENTWSLECWCSAKEEGWLWALERAASWFAVEGVEATRVDEGVGPFLRRRT